MAAEDEIWRPGYDGPTPVSGGISFERSVSDRNPPSAPDVIDRRLVVGAAVTIAMCVAAVIVVGPSVVRNGLQGGVASVAADDGEEDGDDDLEDDDLEFTSPELDAFVDAKPLRLLENPTTPFPGADPRRIPDEVVPWWTIELAPLVADGGANATTWVEAVDSRYVVVGVGDARALTGPAAVHVLDASTGDRLWVTQVEMRVDQVEFVAAVGDALVLTVGSEIVALDLPSGSQLWSGRLAKVDGPLERITLLEGADLLALTGPDPDASVRLIEPATGVTVGEFVGSVIGTDRQGRWYVLRGGKLFEFDLTRPVVVGELVGTVDTERSGAVGVVDGNLVTTLDEELAIGPLQINGERASGGGGITPLTTDFGTPDGLLLVRGIIPLGLAGFATVGGGTISGAEVLDDTVRFAWRRSGTVSASYATERGVVLLVGTDGGAAQTLVDGATGDTIAPLTMSSGLFQTLEVTGNGIVTRRASADGLRMAGLDLDGNELWSLDGPALVSVGDRIVVRSTPQVDGSFEVSAYGEPG